MSDPKFLSPAEVAAIRGALRIDEGYWGPERNDNYPLRRHRLLALCDTCDALREALRPFAALHRAMVRVGPENDRRDEDPVWAFNEVNLLRGDLRRAAELVKKVKE